MLTADIALGYWIDGDGDEAVDDGEICDAKTGGSAYTSSNWTPIGTYSNYFEGSFDGGGYTISGIYINSELEYAGMFGFVRGTIENLNISASYLYGQFSAGGIAILNYSGTIEDCSNTGTVSGDYAAGGIAGANYGTVSYCYNTGAVSGDSAGGVVGGNRLGTVQNCYNTGSVTGSGGSDSYSGGVVGASNGMVKNCYNAGSVAGNGDYVGGVAGDDSGSVTGCYYDKTVCGEIGGINGGDTDGAAGKTTSEMQTATAFDNWDTDVWLFESGQYPQLKTYAATVSPDSKTFSSAKVGYSTRTAEEFTVTNTGTGTITSLSAALSDGTNFEISTALSADSLEPGGTATVSVRPKDGLAKGTYTDTLTITGSNLSLSASLSFTVKKSSGSGGSSSDDSSDAYEAQLSGDGSGSLDVTVDEDTGSASAAISDEQSKLISSGGSVVVTMPEIDGVTDYYFSIPVADLSSGDGDGSLTLSTEFADVTLPSDMLTGTDASGGTTARIAIGAVDFSGLSEENQAEIGGRPVISLSLSIDGEQTDWSNSDAPVAVSIPYTPAEDEDLDAIIIWYIDGDGNLNCVTNGHYDADTGTVAFYTTHFSLYAVGYHSVRFEDVASDAWYCDAVTFCAAREITSGTGNDLFSPDAALTRGQFITQLMRAYGIEANVSADDNFDDAGDTYYTGYLSAAKQMGITNGVGDNLFAPEAEITRQDMFMLLYRVLDVLESLPETDPSSSLPDFSDADGISDYAETAMETFVVADIISGNDGKLDPLGNSTRAQMAQVLYNLLGQ
ncbi:MAG: S-layer homology domain-containing protein [Oscillospiraceae bacterium]